MISNFLLILLAFGLYGIIHSLLASTRAKELAASWLGTEGSKWFRLAYNFFGVLSLLPILALAIILPDRSIYTIAFPVNTIFFLIQIAGVVIMFIAVMQTGLLHFVGLNPLTDNPLHPAQKRLETGGLYRFVRHPIYSGGLLFLWASPEMSWNSLALKIAFSLYFIFGSMVEEKKLVDEFGEDYRAYRMRTPMLIPWFKRKPQ